MPEEQPQTVPARNNFKKEPIFVKATIADQMGSRPGYRRMWVPGGKDQEARRHPQHVEKYLSERWVGDADIGICKADAWTVVERKSAKPGRKRDDDTAGIDTAQTHGDLVLIETPEENAAIFDKYKEMRADRRANGLRDGEREVKTADNGGQVRFEARLGQGAAGDDPHSAVRSVLSQQ